MINLLAPEAKRRLAREYRARVFAVWLFLLAGAAVATALLLAPTYVLLDRQLAALEEQTDAVLDGEDPEAFRETRAAIERANATAAQLAATDGIPSASALLSAVEGAAPQGVSVTRYTYARDAGTIREVSVYGTARNRTAVVTFRDALERAPDFAQASVPIGDLARDSDLPFTITLTVQHER